MAKSLARKVWVSVLVTDGERVGEIWSIDKSPYACESGEAAYVVGKNADGTTWADWICMEDLTTVNKKAAIAEAIAT